MIEKLQSTCSSKKTTLGRLRHAQELHPSLHEMTTRVLGGAATSSASRHRPESDDDMPPYNRIREVIELEVNFEARKAHMARDREGMVALPPEVVLADNGFHHV